MDVGFWIFNVLCFWLRDYTHYFGASKSTGMTVFRKRRGVMTCQTNTMCAASAGKCFSSGLIAVHTAAAVSSLPTRFMLRDQAAHPPHHTHHRPVIVWVVQGTVGMAVRDRCGHSMARVSPADAANTALNFPATTGE